MQIHYFKFNIINPDDLKHKRPLVKTPGLKEREDEMRNIFFIPSPADI